MLSGARAHLFLFVWTLNTMGAIQRICDNTVSPLGAAVLTPRARGSLMADTSNVPYLHVDCSRQANGKGDAIPWKGRVGLLLSMTTNHEQMDVPDSNGLEHTNSAQIRIMKAQHLNRYEYTELLSGRDNPGTVWYVIRALKDLIMQWRVLLLVSYSFIITIFLKDIHMLLIKDGVVAYVDILGWVCGLLITFKQNQAMTRFWEARGSFGAMCANVRDVARVAAAHCTDPYLAAGLALRGTGFVVTTKNLLRRELPALDADELHDMLAEEDVKFVLAQPMACDRPLALLDLMARDVRIGVERGALSETAASLVLEPKLKELNMSLQNLLRIKQTPTPIMYIVTLDIVLNVFLISLPFHMAAQQNDRWIICTVCVILNIVLNGLSKLGRQLEDPFGRDPTDLPLGSYTADVVHQVLVTLDRWYNIEYALGKSVAASNANAALSKPAPPDEVEVASKKM